MFEYLLSSERYSPLQLDTDPEGWSALVYEVHRHPELRGVAFSVSGELEFHGRAATYIRSVYEAEGVEGVVRLTVFERNPNTFRLEEMYSGLLELEEYKITARGVTVPIGEAGFTKKFLASDELAVDLLKTTSQNGASLAPLVPLELTLHSQPLVKRTEFKIKKLQPQQQGTISDGESGKSTIYFNLGEPSINELNAYTYGGGLVSGLMKFSTSGLILPYFEFGEPEPLFVAEGNGAHIIDLNLLTNVRVEQDEANGDDFDYIKVSYFLRIGNNAPILLAQDEDTNNVGNYDSLEKLYCSHNATYQLKIGEKVYLYGHLDITDIHANIVTGAWNFTYLARTKVGSYLSIRATTGTPATKAKGLLVHEALQRCVESITDQPRAFYSEFFGRTDCAVPYEQDGPGALLLVTSSWLIRNFPLADKPLFASFRQLFDSLDAIYCLGVGIELREGRQVVRIEPRAYFYQTTQPLRLDNATSQQKRVLREYIYNTATVGYERWKSGNENGLREFNGKRSYVLPLSRVKGAYKAVSPYVAAGYVIEETRRDQYVATPDRENTGDGQNFLICLRRIDGGGFETDRDQDFTVVQGVLAPSLTYNLRISPGRMLRNHGAWLRTGLLHQNGRFLTQGPPEGNEKIITQLLGEAAPLDESFDVAVDTLGEALFAPEEYSFKTQLSAGVQAQLRANPYRLIEFPDEKGTYLSGFLLSATITPSTRECSFTLLRRS